MSEVTSCLSDPPITVVVSAVDNGDDTATVTVTFSEGVTGFDQHDVIISGTPADVGLVFVSMVAIDTATYELTYNMSNGLAGGSVDIHVPEMSICTIAEGSCNVISNVENLVIPIEYSPPTVVLSIVDNGNDTATITVTFSEAVSGFDAVNNILINSTPSDVGLTWVSTTPTGPSSYDVLYSIDNGINGGSISAYIPDSKVTSNLSGLYNLESNVVVMTIVSDAVAPTVVLGIQDHGDNTATLVVTFSEGVTGFDETDVVITPTPGDVDLIFQELFVLSPSVYELNYIIDDGENGGSVDMQVLASSAQSINAGLDNVDSNILNVPIADVDPPTVVIGIVNNGDRTATLTVTFNEGVVGFTNTDVVITSSNLDLTFNSMNVVSTSVYELTYDINTGTVISNFVIQVFAASAQSIASGLDNLDSNIINFSVHPVTDVPPSVVLSFVDNGNNTVTLTITFSQGVIGFDETDVNITPTPGDVGLSFDNFTAFTAASYQIVYTMINGVDGGSVDAYIPAASGYGDINGLANLESNTINIPIATTVTPPSVSVMIVDNGDDTATLTVVFSAGVTGFDETDITMIPTPGDVGLIFISLVAVTTATYEILYTINNGGNGGSIDVYVPASSAQSILGGLNNTISNFDTLPIISLAENPSVTIDLTDNLDTTATLVVAFSEDVTGFDQTDVTIVPTVNLGLTYNSTVTIDPSNYQLEYTIIDTLGLGEFGTIDVHIPAAGAQSVAAALPNTISNVETLHLGETDPALSFITTWRTTTPDEKITVPLWALGSDITIDWGDGNIETGYLITPSHEYAVAGDYDVTVYGGTVGTYGDIVTPSKQLKCVDVVQFGNIGITNWSNAFFNTSLTVVSATDGPVNAVTTHNMFSSISTLTSMDVSGWDTSSIVTMEGMFNQSSNLTTIGDVSGWNVSNVITMKDMFKGCSSLLSVNLDTWSITNLNSIYSMFEGCTALIAINLVAWNTVGLAIMTSTFRNCTALATIDISGWNVQSLLNASNLFLGVPLITAQYDAILTSWSAQSVQPTVNISFGTVKYTLALEPLRDILIEPPNLWTITDGGSI